MIDTKFELISGISLGFEIVTDQDIDFDEGETLVILLDLLIFRWVFTVYE